MDTSLFHGAGRFSWRRPLRFKEFLKRNADGHPGAAGIPAVVQVIPVFDVHDVNVICFVPVGSPEFRIRINDTEPIATVLETWKTANLHKGEAVNAERVDRAIVAGEIYVRNPVAVIAAALLPCAMLGIKAAGAALLPFASLFALLRDFLLMSALLLNRLIGLPLRNLLVVLVLLLLFGVLLVVLVSLLLLDLLPVLVLRFLLGMLLGVLVSLLLLGLLPALILRLLLGLLLVVLVSMLLGLLPVLLLLLSVLLIGRLLFLPLGMLLRGWLLLLLLGALLSSRFLLLLLASLLRGLGLFFRPVLLFLFLFLLCVPESGGSTK
jgi:hypothetical protein